MDGMKHRGQAKGTDAYGFQFVLISYLFNDTAMFRHASDEVVQ